jgi:hypothetical protein
MTLRECRMAWHEPILEDHPAFDEITTIFVP